MSVPVLGQQSLALRKASKGRSRAKWMEATVSMEVTCRKVKWLMIDKLMANIMFIMVKICLISLNLCLKFKVCLYNIMRFMIRILLFCHTADGCRWSFPSWGYLQTIWGYAVSCKTVAIPHSVEDLQDNGHMTIQYLINRHAGSSGEIKCLNMS